jgi:hypothetical protein
VSEHRVSFEQIRDELTTARDDAADVLDRLSRLLSTIQDESGPEELDFTHEQR